MDKKNLLLIIIVSIIGFASRLLPHMANFSPLASIILFTGVYATNKKYFILPFIALFISDIFIGFYKWEIMLSVYLSLGLIYLLSYFVKKEKNILNITSATLASALLFFLITNLAVWYFGDWYTKDLAGLMLNYSLAIPFFKATLASNIFYSSLMFGVYELFLSYQTNSAQQKS